MMDRPD